MLVVVALGVAALRKSALGSAMLAVRANERSAAAVGVNVVRVKVLSFALASFIAGLGGCLLAYRRSVVTFDSFTAIGGLALLSTAYLAGVTSVWGGLLAGILASTGIAFVALDQWVDLGEWFQVISGVLLIVTLISHPEGLASGGHRIADRFAQWRAGAARPATAPRPPRSAPTWPSCPTGSARRPRRVRRSPRWADRCRRSPPPPGAAALEVEHLTVRYGGVVAVNDVSFRVDGGSIVGLIGPNGAGKTSVIDAVTGFAPATGADPPRRHRARRAAAPHPGALAAWPARSSRWSSTTTCRVEENVSVAAFGTRHVEHGEAVDPGAAERRHRGAARPPGRRAEPGRAPAGLHRPGLRRRPGVLLLDEPAAGLDTTESEWLGDRIRAIRSSGTGVLLVDHDVALVLGVCDHVYVLDFGAVIA